MLPLLLLENELKRCVLFVSTRVAAAPCAAHRLYFIFILLSFTWPFSLFLSIPRQRNANTVCTL
jgi:hypothetical protein